MAVGRKPDIHIDDEAMVAKSTMTASDVESADKVDETPKVTERHGKRRKQQTIFLCKRRIAIFGEKYFRDKKCLTNEFTEYKTVANCSVVQVGPVRSTKRATHMTFVL